MHREVLWSRNHLNIFWIVALQSGYKRDAHARRQEWVLAISFLPAAPAWIAKDIDIRRPEVEPFVNVVPSGADCLIVFGPGFNANDSSHVMDQGRIKSGGKADRFGKYRSGSSASNSVQSLAPPIVSRNLQSGNLAGFVH